MKEAIEQVYKSKEDLIIIGLTGRTGSGCSQVAKILSTESFENLDLKDPKKYDFNNTEERKNRIIYDYMKEPNRWSPFSVIEVSGLILASVFEQGKDVLINYIKEITDDTLADNIHIGDKESLINEIQHQDYWFTDYMEYKLDPNLLDITALDDKAIEKYYDLYVARIKEDKIRFRRMIDEYTCYSVHNDKILGKQQSKYHLYTYLMQQFGNNIRCSGNPFVSEYDQKKYSVFAKRIEKLINIIERYNKDVKKTPTRICIDAIRNPYEAIFLRDKYRSFYFVAVSTNDIDRRNRLNYLTNEEQKNLDNIEYPQKTKLPEEVFYHQSIESCIEYAGIHIYNPDVNENKFYYLTTQLVKYIALMIHPGLITPSHIERCMQLAYNTKFNSGCLSRQVGAVVTRDDFSIQSVGWNDVPKGQIPCLLRDAETYCRDRDTESFSKYELESVDFSKAIESINEHTKDKLCGRLMPYCFKDVYNSVIGSNNQVYTRALHAEENAFLQISKYGGTHVKNGNLFTTASPCELCAKKAYQLGIKHIYYINPYPGISQQHILSFGKENNPKMHLFYGAIGQTYLEFYEPRIAVKDELSLLTDVNIKKLITEGENKALLKYEDIEYNSVQIDFEFINSRSEIECYRAVDATILADELQNLTKKIIWTGSSYDGTELVDSESDDDIFLEQTKDTLPYTYIINAKRTKNEKLRYKVLTKAKDEKSVMAPYLAHMVKNKTSNLKLMVSYKGKDDLFKNARLNIYADLNMETLVESRELEIITEEERRYINYDIKNPNVNYTYAICWEFCEVKS